MYLLVSQGVAWLLIPLAPSDALWMAILGVGTGAIANAALNGLFMGFMQRQADPAKQGRVFSALQTCTGAMMPLGMVLAGPVADAFGIRSWFFAAAIGTIVLGAASWSSRDVRRLDELDADRKDAPDGDSSTTT